MPKFTSLFFAALLASSAGHLAAADQSPSAPPDALSPAIRQAIQQLSSTDHTSAQEAVKNLELALARQMHALAAADDPETQSRIAALLQFNEGLTAWALETLKLPDDQARAQFDFCLRPDVLPAIAPLFLETPAKRVAGVTALQKIDNPQASDMLLSLALDHDHVVRLAAIKALRGKKSTPPMIDLLWARAVDVNFVAKRSAIPFPNTDALRRMEIDEGESDAACETLISFQDPAVVDRLKTILEGIEKTYTNPKKKNEAWVYDDDQYPFKSVARLLKAYKSGQIDEVLFRLATGKPNQAANQGQFFWSTRTTFIATFVELTGQKTEDYKVQRNEDYQNMWAFATRQDEEAAIAKLQIWWAENAESLGVKLPPKPATQPAGG